MSTKDPATVLMDATLAALKRKRDRLRERTAYEEHCDGTCGGLDAHCEYCEETQREQADALADERRDGRDEGAACTPACGPCGRCS